MEFPRIRQAPGQFRRTAQIVDWLREEGASVESYSINSLGPDDVSHKTRLRNTAKLLPSLSGRVSAYDACVVLGLSAPHMMLVAERLSHSIPTVFDVCDSWMLQLAARWRTGRPSLVLPSIAGILIASISNRKINTTYISPRDGYSDRLVNWQRRAETVYPNAPQSLQALQPVNYPLSRFVLAADFRSFHNEVGLDLILEGYGRYASSVDHPVPLEIFGPVEPSKPLLGNVAYIGWAKHIADVYAGNTGVIASNQLGSGVPNKVIEARVAKRPLAMHASLGNFGSHQDHLFDSPESLATVLANMAVGRPGKALHAGEMGRSVRLRELIEH